VGVVTNGAVRDLNAVRASGFQMFAGNVSVSHAYAHVFDFGGMVDVARMNINPGDLLHADRHGVLSIPAESADRIPPVAAELAERRHQIVDLCRSSDFSIEKLREFFRNEVHEHRPNRFA
jgi:4-hydroxy-4-methyl-2-oxoglutarate aldolase